ncbi:MAG: transposase [Bacteroidetes bacterium]|nr:transposase [Bacteroidota bacterium]
MSKGFTSYKIEDQEALYFLTFSTVGWVDLFTRRKYKDVLIESLKYCQEEKGLELYCWVIMSNHVHLIARAKEGFRLSDILRDFKKFTSKKIIKEIEEQGESRREWLLRLLAYYGKINKKNSQYQVWRNDNHPIVLYSANVIDQKMNYIHNNPVEEGIVENAEYYLYSSAKDYAGGKGLLDILFF